MQPQSALIGTDGAVKLHAVASVYLYLTAIVYPRYAKLHKTFRLHQAFQKTGGFILRVLFHQRLQAFQNLPNSLQKFTFAAIAFFTLGIDALEIFICQHKDSPFRFRIYS